MSTHPRVEPHPVIAYERSVAIPEPLTMRTIQDGAPDSWEPISLASYWYVLWKRHWTILGVAFTLMAIVAAISFHMASVYKATARLEIEPETPQLQSVNDLYQRADADDVSLQTQIQVLRSERLAWQTIQQLNLGRSLGLTTSELEAPEKHKAQLMGAFGNSLKVEVVPKTRMLAVGFESSDPETAAQVANSLVNSYLDYNFQEKYEAIRRSGWMDQQLSELKSSMELSQQALVNYEQAHQIVNTGEKQNVLEQMLADLSRELTNAKSDRIQKEALYAQMLANRPELASLVHDELLQKLEERSADLKEQHTETVGQYGPNYPKAQRLQAQIDENKTEIEREQNRVIDRIRSDYNAASNREKLAVQVVDHQKVEVGDLNQLLVQHNILQREFESNQQLYQNLLQHLKDATVSAGLRSTNIHLVDSAIPPRLPIRPRRLFNTLIALWAGLILGVIAAFAQEKLDSTVKTAEEVEMLTVSPALAVIPFESVSWLRRHALAKRKGSSDLALTLSSRPKSGLSEAFRVLGTAVSAPSNTVRTLLVTSSQSGEGKTVTALNLAQVLAQRRGPVVIVDCDLRKGQIAKVLGIPNRVGVSTLLTGEYQLSEALRPYTAHSRLWVLPSGPVPPNPAELLASKNMLILLNELRERFACVIIDSPPVLAVTDATILSSLTDGVILVAASGSTQRSGLIRTRKVLLAAGARILGVTINKFDLRHPGGSNYAYYSTP